MKSEKQDKAAGQSALQLHSISRETLSVALTRSPASLLKDMLKVRGFC